MDNDDEVTNEESEYLTNHPLYTEYGFRCRCHIEISEKDERLKELDERYEAKTW